MNSTSRGKRWRDDASTRGAKRPEPGIGCSRHLALLLWLRRVPGHGCPATIARALLDVVRSVAPSDRRTAAAHQDQFGTSRLRREVRRFDCFKQDLLLQLHDRAMRWRVLSLQSVELATAGRLIHLTEAGTAVPLSRTRARGLPAEVKQILANAEKLGAWCGQLTLHEITTTLKVRL